MEYLDLTPYEYRHFPIAMRSVGWLGVTHGLQGSPGLPLYDRDRARLWAASGPRVSVTLGWHYCEFCPPGSEVKGSAEYRYYCSSGEVFSAPEMILHYVDIHHYWPPRTFLDLLATGEDLVWDHRAERLRAAILDETTDLDTRVEAVVDIARWRDARSLEALLHVVGDAELSIVAGDELGRSLASFVDFDGEQDLRKQEFPEIVQHWFDVALQRGATG